MKITKKISTPYYKEFKGNEELERVIKSARKWAKERNADVVVYEDEPYSFAYTTAEYFTESKGDKICTIKSIRIF